MSTSHGHGYFSCGGHYDVNYVISVPSNISGCKFRTHCEKYPSFSASASAVYCRAYTLMVESYYSYLRGMISRERNSAVNEKQIGGTYC